MEPLHWILSATGVGGILTAFVVNASRKKDAAEDRDQRGQIAEDQLAVANRQADIAAQAVAEAAADRKQQAAIEERRAKIEERRAKEADGTLKALTELLRRTAPPSPPGKEADENTGTGAADADKDVRADTLAPNGTYLSPDTLNALFETDDADTWMTLLGPDMWVREASVSADDAMKQIQTRIDAAAPDHPDRDLGPKIIAFIQDAEAR